jgi:hypothetical protein
LTLARAGRACRSGERKVGDDGVRAALEGDEQRKRIALLLRRGTQHAGERLLRGRARRRAIAAAHLARDHGEVVALDARSLRVVHRWPLTPCEEPTGLAIDATHGRLFAGCHNRTMAVVDTGSGRLVATIPIGEGVDATRFDAGTGLIFASCGDGTLTVAHEDAPDTYTVVDVVTTQRGARTMELDPVTHRVYLVTADYAVAAAGDAPRQRPTTVPNSFVLLVYGR